MYTREEVLSRLRKTAESGSPIVGAGAGTGISAKFAERGGADLILIYNSGKYRMGGHGSNAGLLAIGDANAIVMEMGEREVLPVVKNIPVIAGVNGTDPTRVMSRFLRGVEAAGFSGVINFPSHGIIDGHWRRSLEETGFGYDREVEMIATAHQQGMFTLSYSFTPEEAQSMVDAGVDVVVAHMGLTTGGSIGASEGLAKSLDESVRLTKEIADAAREVRSDVLVVSHGGPIETPADAARVIHEAGVDGFIGASTMERLPVERALTETVSGFKSISMKR
ncbi:phosphoenolpyruvate hydrolase family protein [Ruicaihuangia caeni]|uniref:Phosphoenolpyruvate hydrolase family protein n=1 Tax=Ruicaihuangia caeni TaxID=3042517 RepID=A0AAW6T4V9_9MICO|nr:phosphoenolpyruvate hydrolase family protein [Klugiella sp. YN-L-19]MDI2097384.1 phosphoenolpyruvate hydrolase family protein [Klugiella sp. YN-L-19]